MQAPLLTLVSKTPPSLACFLNYAHNYTATPKVTWQSDIADLSFICVSSAHIHWIVEWKDGCPHYTCHFIYSSHSTCFTVQWIMLVDWKCVSNMNYGYDTTSSWWNCFTRPRLLQRLLAWRLKVKLLTYTICRRFAVYSSRCCKCAVDHYILHERLSSWFGILPQLSLSLRSNRIY